MYRAMEQLAPRSHRCGCTVGSSALAAPGPSEGLRADESVGDPLPAEAEFILSALEAGGQPHQGAANRRDRQRLNIRCVVHLRLFSDGGDSPPWVLYTRDSSPKALGFITRQRLPLGYGGTLIVRDAQGHSVQADCTVHRCRETVSGWFEGCLAFNRAQWCFAEG